MIWIVTPLPSPFMRSQKSELVSSSVPTTDALPEPKPSRKRKTCEDFQQEVAADDPRAYVENKKEVLKRNGIVDSRNHLIRCVKRRKNNDIKSVLVVYLNKDLGSRGRNKAPKVSAQVKMGKKPTYTLQAYSEVTAPIGSKERIRMQVEGEVSAFLEKTAPNEIHFLTSRVSLTENVAMITTPLCEGDLNRIIPELNTREGLDVAAQMVSAIIALHENNIFHRDIQPGNFLYTIDEQGHIQIKIADFETSTILGTEIGSETIELHLYYMDPALINAGLINGKVIYHCYSDIYSLGLTLFNIFAQCTYSQFIEKFQAEITRSKSTMDIKLSIPTWSVWEKIEDSEIVSWIRSMSQS